MNNVIQEMIKDLEIEAKQAGKEILDKAKVQSKEILKKAKEEGEELKKRSLSEANQKLEAERAKMIGQANLAVKKEIIRAKEEVINKLFAKLEDETRKEFESGSSENLLKSVFEEVSSRFDDQKIRVFVNNKDRNLADKLLGNNNKVLAIEGNLDCIGGLIAKSEDSRIIVDNTIDSRLQKMRQVYEPEVISVLFGDE